MNTFIKGVLGAFLGAIIVFAAWFGYDVYKDRQNQQEIPSVIYEEKAPSIEDRVIEHEQEIYIHKMEKTYLDIPTNIFPELVQKVGVWSSRTEFAEEYLNNFEYWSSLSISKTIGNVKIDPTLKEQVGSIHIQTAPAKPDSIINITPIK